MSRERNAARTAHDMDRVLVAPRRDQADFSAPFLWISAFVPTVVPWVSTAISPQNFSNENPRRSAAHLHRGEHAFGEVAGVEGALVAVISPPAPEYDAVGKRAADVDADQQIRNGTPPLRLLF